jgi:hypothetical protein
MAKVAPFHSVKPNDPKKYRDDDACTEGDNIQKENRRQGTSGYPKCDHCERLGKK